MELNDRTNIWSELFTGGKRTLSLVLNPPFNGVYDRISPTFTNRNICDTSRGSAFRSLKSIFFFYSFFLSYEVLCMWSERWAASSFASQWLFPALSLWSRRARPQQTSRHVIARGSSARPLFTSTLIYGARALTGLAGARSSRVSGQSEKRFRHLFVQSRSRKYSRDQLCFWSVTGGALFWWIKCDRLRSAAETSRDAEIYRLKTRYYVKKSPNVRGIKWEFEENAWIVSKQNRTPVRLNWGMWRLSEVLRSSFNRSASTLFFEFSVRYNFIKLY